MSQTTHDLIDAQDRTAQLTESERHRLLEVDRRRHALAVIAERSQPLSLDELAAAVTERESTIDGGGTAVSAVATTLHHIHLPKMDEAGVVEYDPGTNRIVP